ILVNRRTSSGQTLFVLKTISCVFPPSLNFVEIEQYVAKKRRRRRRERGNKIARAEIPSIRKPQ
uniref:Uncharacterized protein n=1 Tax=Romanomermis culicivorax TaxID=13658 RepID=A0A915HNV2_ROMCU